jgi:hypothetical protein
VGTNSKSFYIEAAVMNSAYLTILPIFPPASSNLLDKGVKLTNFLHLPGRREG